MNDHKSKRAKDAPQHAVALQYNESQKIPKVLATGSGDLAKHIVDLAIKNKVPVEENDTLATLLSQLNPGDIISPETYELVAELLVFLYESDLEWRENHKFLDEIIGKKPDSSSPEFSDLLSRDAGNKLKK